jgi:hypothetical protein
VPQGVEVQVLSRAPSISMSDTKPQPSDLLFKEVEKVQGLAGTSHSKSLLLTYVSAIELRLTQVLNKTFLGTKTELLNAKNGNSLSFYQKIELAYRLGIISARMKETLDTLRGMRNISAHDEADIDFDESTISVKIDSLYQSLSEDTQDVFPADTAKEKLEVICSLMIIELAHRRNTCRPYTEARLENAFSYVDEEEVDAKAGKKSKSNSPA